MLQATGLFKGLSSPLLTSGLINAVFFGVYGSTVKAVAHASGNQTTDRPSLSTVTAAGVVAGAVQLSVSCPVDLVKIKLQLQDMSGIPGFY